jgi:hypothetical protein
MVDNGPVGSPMRAGREIFMKSTVENRSDGSLRSTLYTNQDGNWNKLLLGWDNGQDSAGLL